MTNHQQQLGDAPLRKLEYDDGTVVFAADVGAGPDASVDVVGRTVIVVADGEQYEFEVPAEDAEVLIRNGVLTVEVNEEAH
ncbi:DUF7127 family protein [Halomicrobium urmianum]|uniref:DUF7127 family protein n=1 Tax=Halomicrobium urmianum TaxID=1586233 RepID=UPI001CD95DED|nr:hypothetical protein [Halomicrobium urmianum]